MTCLGSVLDSWPHLRRCVLFTGDAGAARLYEETLGMREVGSGNGSGSGGGLVVMQVLGRAGAPGAPGVLGRDDGGDGDGGVSSSGGDGGGDGDGSGN